MYQFGGFLRWRPARCLLLIRDVGPRLRGGQSGGPGGGTGPGAGLGPKPWAPQCWGSDRAQGPGPTQAPLPLSFARVTKFCGIPEVQGELVVVGGLEVPCCGQGICGDRCWGEWGPRQRGERRVGCGEEAAGGLYFTCIIQLLLCEDKFRFLKAE